MLFPRCLGLRLLIQALPSFENCAPRPCDGGRNGEEPG